MSSTFGALSSKEIGLHFGAGGRLAQSPENFGMSSPDSSYNGTPAQEKFVAMRTKTPAKRLLVFGEQKNCHDVWDSFSSGTSDEEIDFPSNICAVSISHERDENALFVPETSYALVPFGLPRQGGSPLKPSMDERQEADLGRDETNNDDKESDDENGNLIDFKGVESSDFNNLPSLRDTEQTGDARNEPGMHSIMETLKDFSQHVDRIEKHTLALNRKLEQDQVSDFNTRTHVQHQQMLAMKAGGEGQPNWAPGDTSGSSDINDLPLSQNDLTGSLNSTSASVKKTALDVKRLNSDFKKNERGEDDIRYIMAKAEMHLCLLEDELLHRSDLQGRGGRCSIGRGSMRQQNVGKCAVPRGCHLSKTLATGRTGNVGTRAGDIQVCDLPSYNLYSRQSKSWPLGFCPCSSESLNA